MPFIKRFSNDNPEKYLYSNILSQYYSKASVTFGLTVILYVVGIICAAAMIVISFVIAFLPDPDFYQKAFSIGMFVMGSGVIVLFLFRNPVNALRQYLDSYVTTQIVLTELYLEQTVCFREIEKIQEQSTPSDLKELEALIIHLQQNADKAIKNLKPQDEWIE